jgi:hypothetical protein
MKCKKCKKETNVVCSCGLCPECAKKEHGENPIEGFRKRLNEISVQMIRLSMDFDNYMKEPEFDTKNKLIK